MKTPFSISELIKAESLTAEARAHDHYSDDPPVDGAIGWFSAEDFDPKAGVWPNRVDSHYRMRCAGRKLMRAFDIFILANILTGIIFAALLALAGWMIGAK